VDRRRRPRPRLCPSADLTAERFVQVALRPAWRSACTGPATLSAGCADARSSSWGGSTTR
jgi:hypothetical protein